MRPRAAAATLTVLVLATAGCSSIAERATESAIGSMSDGEVDLDLSEGGMAIEGEDGESLSFGSSTDVPDEIAAVITVPDGFEPHSTVENSETDGTDGVTVIGTIPTDDPAGLMDGIETQLTGDGWERIGHTNQSDQLIMASYERGEDSFTAQVMVDEGEGMLSLILLRPS